MEINAGNLGDREWLNARSDDELRQLVQDFRLTSAGANLTKELKDEWEACVKYCKKRRKQNWENRDISSGVQGTSKKGGAHRQERMKLPRLVELDAEKRYGKDWHSDKKANEYLWKQYPQFRLIEKK